MTALSCLLVDVGSGVHTHIGSRNWLLGWWGGGYSLIFIAIILCKHGQNSTCIQEISQGHSSCDVTCLPGPIARTSASFLSGVNVCASWWHEARLCWLQADIVLPCASNEAPRLLGNMQHTCKYPWNLYKQFLDFFSIEICSSRKAQNQTYRVMHKL